MRRVLCPHGTKKDEYDRWYRCCGDTAPYGKIDGKKNEEDQTFMRH